MGGGEENAGLYLWNVHQSERIIRGKVLVPPEGKIEWGGVNCRIVAADPRVYRQVCLSI